MIVLEPHLVVVAWFPDPTLRNVNIEVVQVWFQESLGTRLMEWASYAIARGLDLDMNRRVCRDAV